MKHINKHNLIFYGFSFYLIVIIIAQFLVSTNSALEVHLGNALETPSLTHWLGTDDYGRDLLSRVIVGARYTLLISLITLLVTVIIGVPLGLLAGYKKGIVDTVIMRLIDIGLSIPEFVLMIAFASFFKPSIWNLVIAITIIKWMTYTRLTRSVISSEMMKPYIQMAKLFNVPTRTIIWKHFLQSL